jgi:uncharacterized zinc-type alcohol dehydrogenase-like protein
MSTCHGFGAHEAHAHLTPMQFERRALRADDVAIDIAYCGVCHSDAHQVDNDWGNTVFPCVPGHEIVGHVTAVVASSTAASIARPVRKANNNSASKDPRRLITAATG